MRVLAILGPNAAERDVAAFRRPDVELTVSRDAECTGKDAVIVLGGDGTVHRHLAALVAGQCPVLIVPGGSANDFARALGFRNREEAVAAWKSFCSKQPAGANVRQIDLGMITRPGETSRYFCCAGGVGLDAEAAARANNMPPWLRARGGYVLSAVAALAGFRAQQICVRAVNGTEEKRICEPAMFAAFANAPAYGHGMRIAPRANMDDGKLDICFVRQLGKLRLLQLIPTVYSGKHLALPAVEYFQAERVRIESERPIKVHADGEVVGETPVEVEIARRALAVITR